MTPDTNPAMLAHYGLRNEMVTWLIGIGRGDVAALSPAELQKPMEPPKCPKEVGMGYRCGELYPGQPMLYRGEYWLCARCKTRLPVEQFRRPVPKLIDWGDGRGAVPFKGGIAALLALADKQVDVAYQADFPGQRPYWRYVVRSVG